MMITNYNTVLIYFTPKNTFCQSHFTVFFTLFYCFSQFLIFFSVFLFNLHCFGKVKRFPRRFRFRRIRHKFHTFLRDRMGKRKAVRPKRKLALLRVRATVAHIPEHGMGNPSRLHADLVCSARMQTYFRERILTLAFHHLIIQLGVFCAVFTRRTYIYHIVYRVFA